MLTLDLPVSAEFTIRHSRFIVHAAPVKDQAETLAFYERVADPTASHNCWAWKVSQASRANDDGEPAGTAGKPILGAIEGKQLNQVMVVVTRHFGGVKLGVGGLIRAYSGSTAKCLDHGRTTEVHPTTQCRLNAGFSWTGQVHAALETCAAIKLTETFTAEGTNLLIEVREDRLRQLQNLLRDGTRGAVRLLRC